MCKVKSVVFACLILHNVCIDHTPERLAPPSAASSQLLQPTKRAVAEAEAHVDGVRGVYGIVLQSEAQRESQAWSKEKLSRRMNTQSKMRDALSHAVQQANYVRPSRSNYTAAAERATDPQRAVDDAL